MKNKKHIFFDFPIYFNWGHIDPKMQWEWLFFYIPLEQPNQAQFFFVCFFVW